MTTPPIQPAIMSGGSGTRLWPLSRTTRPKQFLPLIGDESLFQETLVRLSGDGFAAPLVIAGDAHIAPIERQAREAGISLADVIIEPEARNTAAVAAAAARWTQERNPEALVLLAPADHHIADADGFRRAVARAGAPAASGRIVTFGIHPTEPHTGFGYIERGDSIGADTFTVAAFHEKPTLEKAEVYLRTDRFCWNAGIFLFAPDAMEAELRTHAPGVFEAVDAAVARAAREGAILRLDATAFSACPSTSIDYAVMEKTSRAAVVGPLAVGWSDIGSWTALSTRDDDDRIIEIDGRGNILNTDGPVLAAIGVEDLVIVAAGDSVLIARRDRAQDVKKIIEILKDRKRTDLL